MSKMISDKEKLTEEKLIFGAGFIDDDLVDEALDYKPRRMSFIPWACTAAAAVVLIAVIAIFARLGGNSDVLPPDSSGIGTSTVYTTNSSYSSLPNDNSGNSTASTTTDITSEPPVEYEKNYGDIFEEFLEQNPSSYGPPPTCEEIMNSLTPDPDHPEYDVDSYYLIEVIGALPHEIYTQFCGESTGSNGNTLYEAMLVEDLISGEKLDKKVYIDIPAGLDATVQLKGDPTYAAGERFTAALSKPLDDWNDVYSTGRELRKSVCDYVMRYDLPEISFTDGDTETMLYFRGRGQARQPISDLPFTTEEINIETVTSTPQNPAMYVQKIALNDLIEFIREPWQQGSSEPAPTVDIGNGMTLTGTPLDSSELEDFPIHFNTDAWELDSAAEEFIDGLEIHAFDALFERTLRLTSYCLSPIAVSHSSAAPAYDSVYIESEDRIRYYETGYTYESFYNEYSRTFTKETIEEMFKKYNVFLNYNGELFCSDGARGGWLGEVHREYELIDKYNTYIEFRRLIFRKDSDDKPAAEYVPELRGEYMLGITDFKFIQTDSGWRAANIPVEYHTDPSYLSPNKDFSVNRVYPDDERVPSDWLPVMSLAECNNNISEIINSDTSDKDRKSSIAALVNKSALCYELFYGVSRELFDIDWDSPYDHPNFENPVYPVTSEYITDIRTINDLADDTYESALANELLSGVFDLKDEPRYFEENGQLYINNRAFPIYSGSAFYARSYVEITEKTDDKCTFIWHYPDFEFLNYPPSGYEFFYYEKTYTAEYIDGSWKLTKLVLDYPES